MNYNICNEDCLHFFEKNRINWQLPIATLKKSIHSDIHYRYNKDIAYVNFQQNQVSRKVKAAHKKCLQKAVSCITLQLAIRIFLNH